MFLQPLSVFREIQLSLHLLERWNLQQCGVLYQKTTVEMMLVKCFWTLHLTKVFEITRWFLVCRYAVTFLQRGAISRIQVKHPCDPNQHFVRINKSLLRPQTREKKEVVSCGCIKKQGWRSFVQYGWNPLSRGGGEREYSFFITLEI